MSEGRLAKLLRLLRIYVAAQQAPVDQHRNLPFTVEEFATLIGSRDPSAMKQLAAGLSSTTVSSNRGG